MSGFDFSQLSDFAKDTINIAQNVYPRESKKFLKKQAEKVAEKLQANISTTTKKKTGRLSRAAAPGKPYIFKGGDEMALSIRGYLKNRPKTEPENSAPHAHLLDFGHNIIPRGKKGKSNTSGGPILGKVKGREFIKKTQNEFESEFLSECEAFASDIFYKDYIDKNYPDLK